MKVYCIGLCKKNKLSSNEYTYFPTFTIEKDVSEPKNVKIIHDANYITLEYAESDNLLNKSQTDVINNEIVPTISSDTNIDETLQNFVKEIDTNNKIPFVSLVEFYKNPNSPIAGEYTAAQLMLMEGITKNPAKNQKGELMCDVHNDIPVLKYLDATASTTAATTAAVNFNAINNVLITQKEPDKELAKTSSGFFNKIFSKKSAEPSSSTIPASAPVTGSTVTGTTVTGSTVTGSTGSGGINLSPSKPPQPKICAFIEKVIKIKKQEKMALEANQIVAGAGPDVNTIVGPDANTIVGPDVNANANVASNAVLNPAAGGGGQPDPAKNISASAGGGATEPQPQQNISNSVSSSVQNSESLYDYIDKLFLTIDIICNEETIKYDFTKTNITKDNKKFYGFYFPYSLTNILQANKKSYDEVIKWLSENGKKYFTITGDCISNSFVILFTRLKQLISPDEQKKLDFLYKSFVFNYARIDVGKLENGKIVKTIEYIPKTKEVIECANILIAIIKYIISLQQKNLLGSCVVLQYDETILNGYTVRPPTTKGGAPNQNHSLTIYGGDPKQDAENCVSNIISKNKKITPEQATRVCNALNGIFTENPDRTENVPKIFEKILHLWFNDSSIIEEIFHAINSPDLCFLHKIDYFPDLNKFMLFPHFGKHKFSLSNSEIKEYYNIDFNFDRYIQTQINGCKSKLLAIPLGFPGHATILIIEKMDNDVWGCFDQCGWFAKPRQIIVDHFDPSYISEDYNKENPVEKLIQNLFKQYAYQINYLGEVCPDIQNIIFADSEKYAGSCTQFSLLYAFKRLLEPQKSREQINTEMEEIFGKDPEKRDEAMANLIRTFQSLVNINFTKNAEGKYFYQVGNRNLVGTSKYLDVASIHTSDDLFDEINKQEKLYIAKKHEGPKYNFANKIIVHNGTNYKGYYFENTDDFEKFAQKIDELHKNVFLNMTYPNIDLLKNALAKKEPFMMLLKNESLMKNASDYQFFKTQKLTDADNKYYEIFVEILFMRFINNGGEIVSKTDIENNKNDYIVKEAEQKGGALKRFAQPVSPTLTQRIYRPVSQRKTDYYNYT